MRGWCGAFGARHSLGWWLAAFLGAAPGGLAAEAIRPAADAPQPLAPEESAAHFRLEEGFGIELVASEPLIAEPSAICWDARGRLHVCELHGYNLEGQLDVDALNKTGKLDTQIRRIQAPEWAKQASQAGTFGVVKRLQDTDGDGRMDRAATLAEGLPPAYGIVPARGGVIVLCAPDIVFLADRDGDGAAEVREMLFSGFGTGALERGINNPRWGTDNWIYAARGAGGGTITGPHLSAPVKLGNTDFRFRADGSALEPVTGSNGTFGQALTDAGERFLITGSQHARYAVPLPHRYLARNPFIPGPGTVESASGYSVVFPASRPHPWRRIRSEDPRWVKFYGAHEAQANGNFTSACSPLIYRGIAFPEAYRGNHFSCDPQQNLVHRCLLERDGAGFRVRRAPGGERSEFLTSTDGWFRPNNLALGPDGAIYVVDMYREIIEDYSAIPRYLQQQYGLTKGGGRGRIWRVFHTAAREPGSPPEPAPDFESLGTPELAAATGHPNPWQGRTARRLLVERGDAAAVLHLERAVAENPTPRGRLDALYALEGLGALRPDLVEKTLSDPGFAVRVHALRLAERWFDEGPDRLAAALERVGDTDASVRLQAAMSLGESGVGSALVGLRRLAIERGDERWMTAAIASSLGRPGRGGALVANLLGRGAEIGHGGAVLEAAAATAGARRDDVEVGAVLVAAAGAEIPDALRVRALRGLRDGLKRSRGGEGLAHPAGRHALLELLQVPSAEVADLALETLGALGLEGSTEIAAALDHSAAVATDAGRPAPERLRAIRLLGHHAGGRLVPLAPALLRPEVDAAVQIAMVAALDRTGGAEVAAPLLEGWAGFSPQVQGAVLDALFSRRDRLPALLDAIENLEVPAAVLSPFHRLRLLEDADPGFRARADRVLAAAAPARRVGDVIVKRFREALDGPREIARGAELFRTHCQICHRFDGVGSAVGPDLAAEQGRADETWLSDLLFPSAEISPGYATYLAETKDGRSFAGVLASESATSLTLRAAGGVEQTILRRNLASLSASPVSLMPETFAVALKPRDAADLIGYLRGGGAGGAPASSGVMLFDDDPGFAELLERGGGTARVVAEEPYSGRAALSVTPLQRHSPRIPGWAYRVVENPGRGEFRYLRLAWRAQGSGVLIELAADGGWPKAEQRERRYYSGKNTSGWGAHQVSPEAPREWAVVTVDLWKDNGAFTLTGIAPTALGGPAQFDRIELLRTLGDVVPGR